MSKRRIPRAEAKEQGLTRYFGVRCKRGHEGWRNATGHCIECDELWRKEHADKLSEYAARNYQKYRDKRRANHKKWWEEQPDAARRYMRDFRARNPDYCKRDREQNAEWYANPDNNAAKHNRRRALKNKAEGTHTRANILSIKEAQNYRCIYCNVDVRKVGHHVDHIYPLRHGGSNDKANLQITCAFHGAQKRDMLPLEFAKMIGLDLRKAPRGQTNEQYRAKQR